MKRSIFLLMTLLLLVSLGATAQDNSRKAMKAKNQTFTDGKTVFGKVSSIDESKIVIENDYGAKKEIKLDSKTKLLNAKNKANKLTDFATGSKVKVTFREADNTATIVQEDAPMKK